MNILLIEDDVDIRELLAFIFETKLQATVIQAETVRDAIDLLKSPNKIDFIFSDYHLPDGTSAIVLKHLAEMKLQLPFILCSTVTPETNPALKETQINAFIQKPFNTQTVIQVVSQVFTNFYSKGVSSVTPDYCPVKLSILLKANILNCDLFIKLSDSKYLKLARSGEQFGLDDYKRHTEKNLDYLYLRSADAGAFLDSFARDTLSLSRAKSLPQNEAFEVSRNNYEIVQQAISSLGFTAEVQNLAESCIALAIRTISNDPAILPYFQKSPMKNDKFLSTHTILLVQISCYLGHLLGWTSQSTQFKLALASFLHDITLIDESLAALESSGQRPETSPTIGESSLQVFLNHPSDVVKLVLKMKNIPTDVDSIILCHHERPNGTGFPQKLNSNQISPLASFFIIAHDLSNYVWLREKEASLKEFFDLYSREYQNAHFKKLSTAIAKAAGISRS